MPYRKHAWDSIGVFLLTLGAVALHGYHYGVEDQFVYLPAIQAKLDPNLFPHDAQLFLLQTRLGLFDEIVASTVRWTHFPLDWVVFFWHLLTVYLLLLGCLAVSRRCFADHRAQWAGVALVAVLLLLTSGGTLLYIADPYLNPRTPATAALLLTLASLLDRRPRAAVWLVVAATLHPTIALCGVFHLVFQAWNMPMLASAAALPLLPAWLAEPNSGVWKEVLHTRWFLYPLQWPWYAWLGVVIPLALLVWFAQLARDTRQQVLEHVTRKLLLSSALGVIIGVTLSVLPGYERIIPVEPMRVLHLMTLLTVLLGGGLLAQHVLQDRPLRWAAVYVPLTVIVLYAQFRLYPASPHIEWPGRIANNSWVQAFVWIRTNTPKDALFALDPRHMERPGEDLHSFRALAQRSMLADYTKDRGIAATWPELASTWRDQVQARARWREFRLSDFQRLRAQFNVDWAVVEQPGVAGLKCPYANDRVLVCRIE
ncbi:MAG: hypothetical protein L0387_34875 [Acidobacteria bacterium]|nr:hypothetical protein [Acidobacteriota bacterium]